MAKKEFKNSGQNMWDKGSIWPENIATPEPNTGRVYGTGAVGNWPNSLKTRRARLEDKE